MKKCYFVSIDFSYDTAENSSEQPLAASASLNSLNKHNIVVWATNNCNKTNPTSGNSSQVSSYYFFQQLPIIMTVQISFLTPF